MAAKNCFLKDRLARKLYHSVENLPLIDWHNHLSWVDLKNNRQFRNLTELWVASDPYKHRAMRICGIPEYYITGAAEDFEKFQKWSLVLPRLLGNPLYHWSALELKRIFGIQAELNPDTATMIWETANKQIQQPELFARALLQRFNVEYIAPCVTLTQKMESYVIPDQRIVPSLRGDNLLALEPELIPELEKNSNSNINSWDDFCATVSCGIRNLHDHGCRFADHALDCGFVYLDDDGGNNRRFLNYLNGVISDSDKNYLRSAVLRVLVSEYAQLNWSLQLHIGALRQTSSRLRAVAGPAGGYAGIGTPCNIANLAHMLNDFEEADKLPATILYTLNVADYAPLAVLSGSFCEDNYEGKVQLGPAWWFCDHSCGIRECLENISAYGVLDTFIGMTTDSRSLLSFVRHEYFRRLLCSWIAEKARQGDLPTDFSKLSNLVANICYNNAHKRIMQGR